jgi:hypothetical protein
MSSTYPPYGGSTAGLCARCGTPLPPNELYCGNCGYQNSMPVMNDTSGQPPSLPNAPWGSGSQQPAYGVGQYGNPLWAQPLATPPSESPPPQQALSPHGPLLIPPLLSLPPQAASLNAQNNYADAAQPAAGSSNYAGMPGQPPLGANYYGGIVTQQPSYPVVQTSPMGSGFYSSGSRRVQSRVPVQPGEEQERPRVGVLIAIIVLLVILVGGGLTGFYVSHQSGKTNTSVVTPTPTPKGSPLFADSFTNNDNGWDLQGDPGKYSVTISNGTLSLEDDDNHLLWELLPGNRTFTDFELFVDVNLSKGDQNNGYGLYIRGASNQNTDLATYYRFELYGDGSYAIFKGVVDAAGNSSSTKLVDYTSSSAILPQGAVNHIEIVARGSSMTLIVNGQTLKTITDSSYPGGSVALFVSNLQGSRPGARATFSNFAIYPLQ